MKYGNSTQSTDLSNTTGVWDSNYLMVQHMGSSLLDSTSNNHNGINGGSIVVDGINGKARYFDGASYVNLGTSTDFSFGTGDYNFSLFLNTTTNFSQSAVAIGRFNGSGDDYWIGFVTGNYINTLGIDGEIAYNDGNYNLINAKRVSSTKYSNVNDATQTLRVQATSESPGGNLMLGKFGDFTIPYYYTGIIDEVRISNIARSDSWISADDYNLRLNTLISIGNQSGFNAVNIGGVWKSTVETKVNIGGVWKTATAGFTNINGVWKEGK